MRHFPSYHFRPDANWVNDPNGPLFFEGKYHLFYQYNPYGGIWDNIHWGHATSKDLIHWNYEPVAVTPNAERGEQHCFSGTSYNNNGKLELLYTSISDLKKGKYSASQVAVTTDDMETWHWIDEDPVLDAVSGDASGIFLSDWRDPFVFEYKGEKLLVIAGVKDQYKKAIHIYKTEDYRKWEYKNVFYSETIDTVFECPNVAVFGDKMVLFYTELFGHVGYAVGTLNDDYSFNVIKHGSWVDKGGFYATNIVNAPDGRVILLSWIREDDREDPRTQRPIFTDGEWMGTHVLPRELTLDEDNEISMVPIHEADSLRDEAESFDGDLGSLYEFNTKSTAFEIEAELDPNTEIVFRVLADKNYMEYTDICINTTTKVLNIFRSKSSLIPEIVKDTQKGYFTAGGSKTNVRIFVDNSVLEVFINKRFSFTSRVYPVNTDGVISMFSVGMNAKVKADVYRLELNAEE